MELNETTLEQILDRQEEKFERALQETRHHMGILAEGLRSEIQAVAEGVSLLREDAEGRR